MQQKLDTPEQVHAFLEHTPGDAVLLIHTADINETGHLQSAALLPTAHVHPQLARAVLPPNDAALNVDTSAVMAIYLQHGQRVAMACLTHPDALIFTLARHFRNAQYAPQVLTPHEPCRGLGHIHVHVATCMVVPRFVKASDHMRVLHKLMQYPLVLERVCLHQDVAHTEEPWLANDLGHRLVGSANILAFLAGMRVAGGPTHSPQKKEPIEINASFAGHAPVRVRDGGLAAAT